MSADATHTADEIFDADIPAPAPATVVPGTREALEHAKTRFACLVDHFKERGEEALCAMSEVDGERMDKALAALSCSTPVPPADGVREGTRLPDTYDDGFTAGRKFERDRQITITLDRDWLGRMVRHAWVEWAKTQEAPKPSWLLAYEELSESDREADRQIGEYLIEWAKKYVPSALSPSGAGTTRPVVDYSDDPTPAQVQQLNDLTRSEFETGNWVSTSGTGATEPVAPREIECVLNDLMLAVTDWSGNAPFVKEQLRRRFREAIAPLYDHPPVRGDHQQAIARKLAEFEGTDFDCVRMSEEACDRLRNLEEACDRLVETRPQAAYDAMIAGGQKDLLWDLDQARRAARTFLSLLVRSSAPVITEDDGSRDPVPRGWKPPEEVREFQTSRGPVKLSTAVDAELAAAPSSAPEATVSGNAKHLAVILDYISQEAFDRLVREGKTIVGYEKSAPFSAMIETLRCAISSPQDVGREATIEECAIIALAIDSGRGNEKEIARAIRSLSRKGASGETN